MAPLSKNDFETSKDLVLYNYFRSSTSYRVRIVLHHKNIPFTYSPIHLLKNGGEQHSPEYLQLNPLAEVPTLTHGKKVISQSFAIMDYLEDLFPNNPMYPQDPFLKAKIKQFCENINSYLHTLGNLKVQQYLEKTHGYSTADKEHWIQHWTNPGLKSLEFLLQEFSGAYCFGEQLTMADAFLAPQVFSCLRFKVDLSPFPLIQKMHENLSLHPAIKAAHPFRQIDTPESEKII